MEWFTREVADPISIYIGIAMFVPIMLTWYEVALGRRRRHRKRCLRQVHPDAPRLGPLRKQAQEDTARPRPKVQHIGEIRRQRRLDQCLGIVPRVEHIRRHDEPVAMKHPPAQNMRQGPPRFPRADQRLERGLGFAAYLVMQMQRDPPRLHPEARRHQPPCLPLGIVDSGRGQPRAHAAQRLRHAARWAHPSISDN